MKHDPSTVLADRDKLTVFLSSTIKECAAERLAAIAGVKATNNECVVFEKLGSRPYPPRDVYLSRLRQSQIVVSIYKSSYGYIAPKADPAISGLEDEYRHSVQWGKWLLVYVQTDKSGREPRLQSLIDEISQTDTTIYFYDKPEELTERIRDDVTALVTQRFLDADALDDSLRQTSAVTIQAISRGLGPPLERKELFNHLTYAITSSSVVCVEGPAGIGKTVLVSQLAQTHDWPITFAESLTPKELFGALVNKLKRRSPETAQQFATLEGAKLAFESAWADQPECTIVIDASSHISEVKAAIADAGGFSPGKKLIFTSRTHTDSTDTVFTIPPFSAEEISALVSSAGVTGLPATQSILETTGGVPLSLRQLILTNNSSTADVWSELPATAREVATYIALSPRVLTIEDLLALRDDAGYGPEHLVDDLDRMPALIIGTGVGFRPTHQQIRDELVQAISARAERFQFAASRLGTYLANKGRVVDAYFLLRNANNPKSKSIIDQAAYEAARFGDQLSSIEILRDMMALDKKGKLTKDKVHTALALAQAYEHTGDLPAAAALLEDIRRGASGLGREIQLTIKEAELAYEARHTHLPEAIANLRKLKDELTAAGMAWRSARVAMEICVSLINSHDGPAAETEAREALKIFEEVDDSYGCEVARRNLASALAYQSGREAEIDEIIDVLQTHADPQESRRHRAWVCNMLVKRSRQEGKPDKAIEYAQEAIALGRQLGDEVVVAINLIGLANARTDKSDYDDAIREYAEAASIGQRLRRRDVEAHASVLIADTYNELPDTHPDASTAAQLAEFHARHAAGLLRDTIGRDHYARALKALGDALQGLGRPLEAAEAYFEGAAVLREIKRWNRFEQLLMTGSHLTSSEDPELYLIGIYKAFGLPIPEETDGSLIMRFHAPLPDILDRLPQNAMLPFLGVHFRLMFSTLPQSVGRHVFERVFETICKSTPNESPDAWRVVYPTLMLIAAGGRALSVFDISRLSIAIADKVDGVSVRSTSGVWYVSLRFDGPVMITLTQMDDERHSALACLVLALFLKGFEDDFRKELFGGISLRPELEISVTDVSSAPIDIQDIIRGPMGTSPCQSSRPVSIADDDPTIPTYIFLNGDIFADMTVGEGRGGALQILIGLTAFEAAYRLLNGQVDAETLRPKLVRLVRNSIS